MSRDELAYNPQYYYQYAQYPAAVAPPPQFVSGGGPPIQYNVAPPPISAHPPLPPPPPPPVPVGAHYHQPMLGVNYTPYATNHPYGSPPFSPNIPQAAHLRTSESNECPNKKKEKGKNQKKEKTGSFGSIVVNHRHKLRPRAFKTPHTCGVCQKFIYGFGIQGLYCIDQDCFFRIHKDCAKKEVERGTMDYEQGSSAGINLSASQIRRLSPQSTNNNNNNNNHEHVYQLITAALVPNPCFFCRQSVPPPQYRCTVSENCKTFAHRECLDRNYNKQMFDVQQQINQRPPHPHPHPHPHPPHPLRPSASHPAQKLADSSYLIQLQDIRLGPMIGSGACGEVYFGRLFGAEVAVKMLNIVEEQFERVSATFYHELAIMMKLHHPNIVLLMGACTEAHQFLIVTEFTQNGSLHDVLHVRRTPQLTWPMRMQVAEHTALGMNWLHMQRPQILHRDLKTANILIDRNMVAKICDFGISRVFENLDNETGFFGSPIYSAPECLLQKPYDSKGDCFSYSYVLWELVTNQIPYDGMFTSFEQLVEALVVQGYRAPIPSSCGPHISDLIRRCWSPIPQERPSFQSILDSNVFRLPEVVGLENGLRCDVVPSSSTSSPTIISNSPSSSSFSETQAPPRPPKPLELTVPSLPPRKQL